MFPALAVAEVLRARGHRLLFVGTESGMESRLVPEAGFEIEFIPSGGLNRVSLQQRMQTALQMPGSIWAAKRLLSRFRPQAVFSMGGFVSGPVMAAAVLARIPIVIMEPNAIPGFANRRIAKYVYRALVGFEATSSWFPRGRTEVTGLPVRPAFFRVQAKNSGRFTILITGGSRGARTLNRAARESWPLFRQAAAPLRIIHQTGASEYEAIAAGFRQAGVDGEVTPFIKNIAEAFEIADLVIGRSGAGGVNEIAAAGMASLLVPFPFAADDHQKKNAEMLVAAGAARMVLDHDFSGAKLFHEVEGLRAEPEELRRMKTKVRQFAKPGAAERAAAVLEEAAAGKKTR